MNAHFWLGILTPPGTNDCNCPNSKVPRIERPDTNKLLQLRETPVELQGLAISYGLGQRGNDRNHRVNIQNSLEGPSEVLKKVEESSREKTSLKGAL